MVGGLVCVYKPPTRYIRTYHGYVMISWDKATVNSVNHPLWFTINGLYRPSKHGWFTICANPPARPHHFSGDIEGRVMAC